MLAALAALLLSCAAEAPVPLPEAQRKPPATSGRMVRMGEVQGWISRPVSPQGGAHPGRLVLVEVIDAAARDRATAEAEAGAVVLVVEPPVDAGAARDYLAGMPGVTSVETRCERASCP